METVVHNTNAPFKKPDTNTPIGLIAGYGTFPLVFAQSANKLGFSVSCAALKDMASDELKPYVDDFFWCGAAKMGKMIRYFKNRGVHRVVMAGKFHKANILYKPWKVFNLLPDFRTIKFWYLRNRKDNKDDTILLSVIAEFNRDGLEFASALDFCPEILVKPGTLTSRKPTSQECKDIAFGWPIAREMGRLDIGQSIVIKDLSVLAVEAVEGTDKNIQRAGELCKAGGFVVVKVAKPNQDRRFDVPTIGTGTVESINKARGKVLAIEAGQTIILDEQKTIDLANRYGISIISLTDDSIQNLGTS